jgi:ABC-2 type transport system ATP-binding protein
MQPGSSVPQAIVAEGLSKRFNLTLARSSFKDRLFHHRSHTDREDFWALKEMDLSVAQGETVGILGHNGSGKSTLLKCVAGILKPTTGRVQVRGRMASLLELGAGFHPDLSGRENIFINASFLAIPKKEIARRFDEIVAFAELEAFIDQQVKHYSSGMVIRLGFAVAINVDPELLLIDEVLSVGDEAFQLKCLDRIEEFQREGRTILFVTHSAEQVRRFCNRAVVLHHGEKVADGEPADAIRIFRERLHGTLHDSGTPDAPMVDPDVKIVDVRFEPKDREHRYVLAGDPLRMVIGYECHRVIDDAVLEVQVRNQRGEVLFAGTSHTLGCDLPPLGGSGEMYVDFETVPLLDGQYPVSIQLRSHGDGRVLALRENQDQIEVLHHGRQDGLVLMPARMSVR